VPLDTALIVEIIQQSSDWEWARDHSLLFSQGFQLETSSICMPQNRHLIFSWGGVKETSDTRIRLKALIGKLISWNWFCIWTCKQNHEISKAIVPKNWRIELPISFLLIRYYSYHQIAIIYCNTKFAPCVLILDSQNSGIIEIGLSNPFCLYIYIYWQKMSIACGGYGTN